MNVPPPPRHEPNEPLRPRRRVPASRGTKRAAARPAIYGVGVALLLAPVGALLVGFTTGGFGLVIFGLIQWAWLAPLWYSMRNNGELAMARGLAITGLVLTLLWGGCTGLLMASF